ncbi:MAG: ATP-binding protein [Eubacterium sp.]|nr:ATP-binding protein [Eubacterium sp.]
MSTLYVMVGIPASGKSTKVNEFVENGAIAYSSDVLRGEMFGDPGIQFTDEWLEKLKYDGPDDYMKKKLFVEKYIFSEIYNRIEKALVDGKDVVMDATNPGKNTRKRIMDRLKKYADRVVAVVMATPFDVCMERNQKRDRTVPEEAMIRIRNEFEFPELEEGFDEIIYVNDKNDIDYFDYK